MSLRMKPLFWLAAGLLVTALACSNDDNPTSVNASGVAPLDPDHFPLFDQAVWDYVRVERGVFSPDTFSIQYYNQDVPAGWTTMTLSPGASADERILHAVTRTSVVDTLLQRTEFTLAQASGGIDISAVNLDSLFGRLPAYLQAGLPNPWIRFGETRWVIYETSYADRSIDADYGGEEDGKIVFDEALGLDYARIIYDGSSQPDGIFDLADVDYDTYLDGVQDLRIVGEVIGSENFRYANVPNAKLLFPQLIGSDNTIDPDAGWDNCRWVRFSIEATVFLTNQRDPNAQPGQSSVNPEYLPGFSYTMPLRLDLGMMLLAPGEGPIVIVDCIDMDKQLMAGEPGRHELRLLPDLLRFDYLLERR
jgi:hypothetical protein